MNVLNDHFAFVIISSASLVVFFMVTRGNVVTNEYLSITFSNNQLLSYTMLEIAQVDIFRYLVLFKTQRHSVYYHRRLRKPAYIHI